MNNENITCKCGLPMTEFRGQLVCSGALSTCNEAADETKKELIPAPVYKHTEGVWVVANSGDSIIFYNGIRYEGICELYKTSKSKEIGEMICKAVNSFPALVDALKEMIFNFEDVCELTEKQIEILNASRQLIENAAQ